MAKLKLLPKGEVGIKHHLGKQYRGFRTWLTISVVLNVSLILIVAALLLKTT